MSEKISYDPTNNITTFKIETPEGYSAFKMGYDSNDYRHWARHTETQELQQVMAQNIKHSQIVVNYHDGNVLLKNR